MGQFPFVTKHLQALISSPECKWHHTRSRTKCNVVKKLAKISWKATLPHSCTPPYEACYLKGEQTWAGRERYTYLWIIHSCSQRITCQTKPVNQTQPQNQQILTTHPVWISGTNKRIFNPDSVKSQHVQCSFHFSQKFNKCAFCKHFKHKCPLSTFCRHFKT